MKRRIGLAIALVWTMLIGTGCSTETKTFTLSGVWIITGSGTPDEKQKVMNSQQTSVVVSRIQADGAAPEEIQIAKGTFTDGSVVFEGEINERTEVQIAVTRGEEVPMTVPAVLIPGANTSFALLDKDNSFAGIEDELLIVEDYKLAEESEEKFRITGDLSTIDDKDLSVAVAYINVMSSNPVEGTVLSDRSNAVLLRDGKFSIEGIAHEPIVVQVWVSSRVDVYAGLADAVVEPGARIRISPSKSSSSFAPGGRASELMANSEIQESMHTKVIEVWQNSTEYLEKMDEYALSIKTKAQQTAADTKTENEQTTAGDSVRDKTKSPTEAFRDMSAVKTSILIPISQNLDEPMSALLAMELGAGGRELENWDKLATVLDKDLVARRVLPQREALDKQIRVLANANVIVAGHKAPKFTLENLDGKDVALYDVLDENEVVLIDFWASWCHPCIAKLPKLKEMHAEYKDRGFEIVFVSIDDTYEDWKAGSVAHEVPGVNLGDLNGFLGETPVDYGVDWIPAEFLLQPDGEILNRGLAMEDLEKLLGERFGNATEQEKKD